MRRVAIVGAHTEIARSLSACIEEREIPIELKRYTTTDHVDDGIELVGPETIGFGELLVITLTGELAQGIAKGARAAGKAVIDLSGDIGEDCQVVWPVLDPQAVAVLQTSVAAVPVGLAGPIVAVVRALGAFDPKRLSVATYESAAVADKPGIDELLAQTRAVYTMQEVKSPVFGEQLAFSCLPGLDQAKDDVLAAQIEAGADTPLELTVSRVVVPTFSVDGAWLQFEFGAEVPLDVVEAALDTARGLRRVDGALGSGDAVDRDDALVGRLRINANRLDLWLAADRMRCGAALPAALLLERWADQK